MNGRDDMSRLTERAGTTYQVLDEVPEDFFAASVYEQ